MRTAGGGAALGSDCLLGLEDWRARQGLAGSAVGENLR